MDYGHLGRSDIEVSENFASANLSPRGKFAKSGLPTKPAGEPANFCKLPRRIISRAWYRCKTNTA